MVTEAVKPMAGDVAGNDNGDVTDSRSLVDSLVASGALDPLFERIDGGRIPTAGTARSPRGWCPGVPGGRAHWTR